MNRRAKPKIYSWHRPEVECIGKGKARAPYEFGCKATITTTNGRAKSGTFILHADALHGNPFDGHTLGEVLKQTAALTGNTSAPPDGAVPGFGATSSAVSSPLLLAHRNLT